MDFNSLDIKYEANIDHREEQEALQDWYNKAAQRLVSVNYMAVVNPASMSIHVYRDDHIAGLSDGCVFKATGIKSDVRMQSLIKYIKKTYRKCRITNRASLAMILGTDDTQRVA